jgi:hypothetical protein
MYTIKTITKGNMLSNLKMVKKVANGSNFHYEIYEGLKLYRIGDIRQPQKITLILQIMKESSISDYKIDYNASCQLDNKSYHSINLKFNN